VDTTIGGNGGVFTNYGTIVGLNASFKSDFALQNDTFVNFGTMQGDVVLGGGSDTFTNRGAGVVNGTIFGGAGTDTFILGAGAETINGGEGTDYVDFRQSNGVRFTLDDSFDNTGLAAGDTFVFIEGVYGSRRADFIVGGVEDNSFDGAGGNDTLIGGAGLDSLFGGNGVDRINGGDGADLLLGGGGKDIITGGLGDDEFRFSFLTDGGDVITDFSNRAGNNDRITISADELAIFGILGPRALFANEFHVGRTNIAPGAEDRIIVRTTDNTVWFDGNGRAAGGLTMLADLQAGVTLTFQDFFFV
jgi:Ca2+-binding RTX toxin-like protein